MLSPERLPDASRLVIIRHRRVTTTGDRGLHLFRNGERYPGELFVVLHEHGREAVLHPRPGHEDAQRLIGLEDRGLLSLDDDVAFLDPAVGRRAGWVDRGHRHDRLTLVVARGRQIKAKVPRPIIVEDTRLCFRPRVDRDVHDLFLATPAYFQRDIATDRRPRGRPR